MSVARGAVRKSSSEGPRRRPIGFLFAAALFFCDSAAHPEEGGEAETIRGPWTGAPYRGFRDGRAKGFVGPDGTLYTTPQDVVEADARLVAPIRLRLTGDLADAAVDAARADERVLVTILFKEQPLHSAGADARDRHADTVRTAVSRVHAILGRIAPLRTSGGNGERIRVRDVLDEEARLLTKDEQDEIRRSRDLVLATQAQARREALDEATPAVDESQSAVRGFIEALPGATFHSRSVALNALTATVPAGVLVRLLREFPEIARIDRDSVHKAQMDTSTVTIGADDWWNAGYAGSSATAVAILDTGIDANHPAVAGGFNGAGVFHATAIYASDYNDNNTSTDDLEGHGTHVAGTVASYDSVYAGVAPGAYLLTAKVGYRDTSGSAGAYDSDVRAGGDWAANNGAVAMNYSFGSSSSTTNATSASALFFDAVCYGLAIPVAVSAGNTGPNSSTIGTPGDAYNVIAVGNFSDNGTTYASDDFLYSSSSRGPCSDGRRKPDLSAPGRNIKSCAHNWEGANPNFVEMTGTSMASPHVAGAYAILLDYGAAGYPEGLKALLLGSSAHTSPYNSSPNSDWGYGALDLGRAFTYRASATEGTLASSAQYVFLRAGSLPSGGRVTLVWNRHVLSNGTSSVATYYAAADLDLYAYDEGTNAALGSSTSGLNNVEQIAVSAASTAPVVQIYLYGALPTGVTTEYWGIAAESASAMTVVSPPALTCEFAGLPAAVPAGATFDVGVTVRNTGDLRSFAPAVTLTVPTGYAIVSGANPQVVQNLQSGATAAATWTVTAATSPGGVKTFRAQATSISYEETYTSPLVAGSQKLDIDAPTGTISAADYASQLALPVTLSASDATTSVTSMRLRDASAAWGSWIPYSPTATVALSPGDGTKTVQAEFRDAVGNVSSTASDTVVFDTVAPTGFIVLQGGAAYGNANPASVYVAAADGTSGVRRMRFSSDGATWRAWRNFESTTSESLPGADGPHTLYAQFEDGAGNVSLTKSDDIILDTTTPTGVATLLGGAKYSRPWSPLTAELLISTDLSGVDVHRYSTNMGATWTAWLPFTGAAVNVAVPSDAGDRVLDVRFQVRDRAQNVSAPFTDAIYVLSAAPQDASAAKTLKGALAAGEDVDAFHVDLLAGQVLSVRIVSRAAVKKADLHVDLDLYADDGTRVVEGRYPAAAPRPGIVNYAVQTSGRHWLVARAAGADAAVGATYTLAFAVKTPKAVTRLSGVMLDEPDVGASIEFDAAPGWKLSGTITTTVTTTPTLVGADGSQSTLLPVRPAGKTRKRIAPVVLSGGIGRYRLVLPGVSPGAWSLTLTPPRRGRLTEAATN